MKAKLTAEKWNGIDVLNEITTDQLAVCQYSTRVAYDTGGGALDGKENRTMKASEMFGGQFLSASDLDGKPVTGTIEAISTEVLEGRDGRERERIIMHLSGIKKPMVVNATNGDKLITAYGDETDNWVGNKVTLTKGKVRFGKDWIDTIVATPAPAKK